MCTDCLDISTDKFQFRYGSIKTIIQNKINRLNFRFQFRYGSIKTISFFAFGIHSLPFQFRYGSIKTFDGEKIAFIPYKFQFRYGSIKTRFKNRQKRRKMKVFWLIFLAFCVDVQY